MLCVVVEETERVIGERRLGTLRDLAAEASAAASERELFAAIDRSLARNPEDLPFAFAYTAGDEDHLLKPMTAGAPDWPAGELPGARSSTYATGRGCRRARGRSRRARHSRSSSPTRARRAARACCWRA